MGNENLHNAKVAKNDEFYTQYPDIQKEINAYLEYDPNVFKDKTILLPCDDPEWSNFTKFFAQNFENFGLKKLISTSYAKASKLKLYGQMDLFEDTDYITKDPNYQSNIDAEKGKIFTLTRKNKKVDINDLKWEYLNGDGDFRSDEIKKLRDEADYIVTNPPFSMFRGFISWVKESSKGFLVIGNINAITYKEVFPLIKENKMWLGATGFMTDMVFEVPKGTEIKKSDKDKAERLGYKGNYTRLGNSCWFTSLEHGRRHQPLQLMSMADNIKFNKKLKDPKYPKYANYDAIEIGAINAIPSDYDGVMGVPITFLDKYCPEQFEILGLTCTAETMLNPVRLGEDFITEYRRQGGTGHVSANMYGVCYYGENGQAKVPYGRILIRRK